MREWTQLYGWMGPTLLQYCSCYNTPGESIRRKRLGVRSETGLASLLYEYNTAAPLDIDWK